MVADPSSVRRAAAFVGVIAALGFAGTAALATLVELPRRTRVQSVAASDTASPQPGVDLSVSLPHGARELRETLSSRTRLRPDRRALMALAELQRLVDGSAPAVAATRWPVTSASPATNTRPTT